MQNETTEKRKVINMLLSAITQICFFVAAMWVVQAYMNHDMSYADTVVLLLFTIALRMK